MNTIRAFSSLGCSFKGFQSFLRSRNLDGRFLEDDFESDVYWHIGHGRDEAIEDLNHNGIHINQLPDELLIKIFSYMTARTLCHCVLPVCRLWYKLGNDPVLWTWLDFSYQDESTHITMVKTVSLRFQFISSMTLNNFRNLEQMERMLVHMGNNCARLREVQLFNCALRSEVLIRLGEMCPNITSLSLICCDENYRKNHYMHSYMKDCSFITAFPSLTSLYLFRTLALATLSYNDARDIVTTCTNLKRLALDCDFYGRAIRHIINSLSASLEVLWLQGRNYNDAMCAEIGRCKKLRKLGVSHAENITPLGLQSLAKLKGLEKLLLYHANNISSKAFREFFNAAKLTKLTYVNLSGCKNMNASVEAIIRKSCPHVRRVIVGRRPIRLMEAYVDFGLYHHAERDYTSAAPSAGSSVVVNTTSLFPVIPTGLGGQLLLDHQHYNHHHPGALVRVGGPQL